MHSFFKYSVKGRIVIEADLQIYLRGRSSLLDFEFGRIDPFHRNVFIYSKHQLPFKHS